MTKHPFGEYSKNLGELLKEKNIAYGDSFMKTGDILRILYPDGIRPDQYEDASSLIRIIDKMVRISNRGNDGQDTMSESPFKDIGGYGILGWIRDDTVKAAIERDRLLTFKEKQEDWPDK